jgi:HEAT repeat protein
MNARATLLFGVFFVGALGTLFWWAMLQAGEPAYRGRSLTSWVRQGYGPSATREQLQRANEAVRAIGTNALPFWVKMLSSTNDSSFRAALNADVGRKLKFNLTTAEDRRYLGQCAFHILGEEGKSAISSLSKLLNDFQTCALATVALAGLGPEGLAAITNALSNPKNPCRYWIAASLGNCAKPPNFYALERQGYGPWEPPASVTGVVVPALINCLKEDDLNLRVFSAQSLGFLIKEPARVVPALTDLLQRDTNVVTRVTTIAALGRFGSAAKPAKPEINRYLQDPDPLLRGSVTKALEQISPEAATAAGVK